MPWWQDQSAIRRRVEDCVGRVPEGVWHRLWRDHAPEWRREAVNSKTAEVLLSDLIAAVRDWRSLVEEWLREPETLPLVLGSERGLTWPQRIRQDGGANSTTERGAEAIDPDWKAWATTVLRRRTRQLATTREVQEVRSLWGGDPLEPGTATRFLHSPLAQRLSARNYRYLTLAGMPPNATVEFMPGPAFHAHWDDGEATVPAQRLLSPTEQVLLRWPEHSELQFVTFAPESAIGKAWRAAQQLRALAPWTEQDAFRWLLTGQLPEQPAPIASSFSGRFQWIEFPDTGSAGSSVEGGVITLRVWAGVPEAVVAVAYRDALAGCSQLFSHHGFWRLPRRPASRTLALAAFWDEWQASGAPWSWRSALRSWNAAHSDDRWSYPSLTGERNFARDLRRAVQAVFGPWEPTLHRSKLSQGPKKQ